MIALLSKILIKNNKDYKNPQVRTAYGVLCGCVGVFLNVLLFAIKLFAGTVSGSVAITADALNNLSDAGSSVCTLLGFKLANQKPDPEHPFGHGRMEYLSGLVVAALILIMGVELAKSSLGKIFNPEDITFSVILVIILSLSILVKGYMFLYNSTTGKKIDSAAMIATGKDSLNDMISTFVVLLSTLIFKFTGLNVDGYCGALVAIIIIWAGIGAAKDTINPLLGQAPDEEFVNEVERIAMSFDEIVGIHDLVVHNYGPGRLMISLHAEVPAEGDILELHDVIDQAEHELREQLKCEAVIHMDPVTRNDKTVDELKQKVKSYLAEIDDVISMHDFRIVKGTTHTNLVFDIVVPFKYPINDEDLKKRIALRILQDYPNHFAVIEVDKKYVR